MINNIASLIIFGVVLYNTYTHVSWFWALVISFVGVFAWRAIWNKMFHQSCGGCSNCNGGK